MFESELVGIGFAIAIEALIWGGFTFALLPLVFLFRMGTVTPMFASLTFVFLFAYTFNMFFLHIIICFFLSFRLYDGIKTLRGR